MKEEEGEDYIMLPWFIYTRCNAIITWEAICKFNIMQQSIFVLSILLLILCGVF